MKNLKKKLGMERISKELLIAGVIGVLIGLIVLSYASNNNLTKLGSIEVHDELALLANEIITTTEISNKGVLNSLASKVMAANRALDAGDTQTAIQKLEELIAHVTDQTGKHITAGEAEVLIGLAGDAIDMIAGVTAVECDPMCIYEACELTNMPPELIPECEAEACSPGGVCYPE